MAEIIGLWVAFILFVVWLIAAFIVLCVGHSNAIQKEKEEDELRQLMIEKLKKENKHD